MLKKFLRPMGYVGSLLIGAVAAYFFHDKIKEQVSKITGKQ